MVRAFGDGKSPISFIMRLKFSSTSLQNLLQLLKSNPRKLFFLSLHVLLIFFAELHFLLFPMKPTSKSTKQTSVFAGTDLSEPKTSKIRILVVIRWGEEAKARCEQLQKSLLEFYDRLDLKLYGNIAWMLLSACDDFPVVSFLSRLYLQKDIYGNRVIYETITPTKVGHTCGPTEVMRWK